MQNPEAIDKVAALLREFAGAVGGSVKELWPIAVRYNWGMGMYVTIGCSISLIFCAFVFRWGIKKANEDKYENFGYILVTGFSAILMLLSFIAIMFDGIPRVISPDGHLLMQIISGGKK